MGDRARELALCVSWTNPWVGTLHVAGQNIATSHDLDPQKIAKEGKSPYFRAVRRLVKYYNLSRCLSLLSIFFSGNFWCVAKKHSVETNSLILETWNNLHKRGFLKRWTAKNLVDLSVNHWPFWAFKETMLEVSIAQEYVDVVLLWSPWWPAATSMTGPSRKGCWSGKGAVFRELKGGMIEGHFARKPMKDWCVKE